MLVINTDEEKQAMCLPSASFPSSAEREISQNPINGFIITNVDVCPAGKAQGTPGDIITMEPFLKRPHFIRDLPLAVGSSAVHWEVSRRSLQWLRPGVCYKINCSHLHGVKIASPSVYCLQSWAAQQPVFFPLSF